MKKQLLLLIFSFLIVQASFAQIQIASDTCIPDLGTGDGMDGAGTSLSNVIAGGYTLDVNGNFNSTGNVLVIISGVGNNILNFHNFTLNAGHIFSINESAHLGPLVIKCTGTATIDGIIDLSGGAGATGTTSAGGAGGVGGPCGGFAGGAGGKGGSIGYKAGNAGSSFPGTAGGGSGGPKGDLSKAGGGGGSGYSVNGMTGGKSDINGSALGGYEYGDAMLTTILNGTNLPGGSGGGGGGGAFNNGFSPNPSGGGGGGGGGAIQLAASTIDLTNGFINVTGGNGGVGLGNAGSYFGAGGGGGSAGTVLLQYVTLCTNCGTAPNSPSTNIGISGGTGAVGGTSNRGGDGAPGRFLLTELCPSTTAVKGNSGEDLVTVFPNPSSDFIHFDFHSNYINATLQISDLAGRNIKCIPVQGKEVILKREHLTSGIYIYKYIAEDKACTTGRMVIM